MKIVTESMVIMHELVLPNDTNILGYVLGGRVMHLFDICAAMSAYTQASLQAFFHSRVALGGG